MYVVYRTVCVHVRGLRTFLVGLYKYMCVVFIHCFGFWLAVPPCGFKYFSVVRIRFHVMSSTWCYLLIVVLCEFNRSNVISEGIDSQSRIHEKQRHHWRSDRYCVSPFSYLTVCINASNGFPSCVVMGTSNFEFCVLPVTLHPQTPICPEQRSIREVNVWSPTYSCIISILRILLLIIMIMLMILIISCHSIADVQRHDTNKQ